MLFALAGCGSANAPIAPKYLDPGFSSAVVPGLVFVSVVDVRRDKTQPFDVKAFMEDSGFRWRYVKVLKDRGYALTFPSDFGAGTRAD